MREVECYQLEVVVLTSTYSLSSETVFLDREWTLFFFGIAQGSGAGRVWGFLLGFLWGLGTLTVACPYAPNNSSEYSAFLETLNEVVYGTP